jgi:hypothetical protein
MRVKIRRPQYQRNVRVLLGAALLIPAAGFLPASVAQTGAASGNPGALVPVFAVGMFGIVAIVCVYDALRWIVIVTPRGIGIAGTLGASTAWLAWSEIVRVETRGSVAILTTRSQEMYQLELTTRTAEFLGRMVHHHLVRS